MKNDFRRRARRATSLIAPTMLALGIAACSDAPVRPEAGSIDVRPKANKNYIVDGDRTITFVELEQLVAGKKPGSIVLEQSRIREGAACIVMRMDGPGAATCLPATRTRSGARSVAAALRFDS